MVVFIKRMVENVLNYTRLIIERRRGLLLDANASFKRVNEASDTKLLSFHSSGVEIERIEVLARATMVENCVRSI